MISVKLICVGKMHEKFYEDAFSEYEKRLGAFCRFECTELQESRLPGNPGKKEIAEALRKEAETIKKNIPKDAYVIAMCVEGKKISSENLAQIIYQRENSGKPRLCFIIGGSYGLADSVKSAADERISVSDMTFPHHLFRVMLAEQIYRGFKINEGSTYHK